MLRNNLIYHVDEEGKEKLCIPTKQSAATFQEHEHIHQNFELK